MNSTESIHTARCIRAMARQEAYDGRWPKHCGECFGAGATSRYDPRPPRISLSPGTMQDDTTCRCVDRGLCPRCGLQLLGPTWRPLNIRLFLGQRADRLAARAQNTCPQERLVQAFYWRSLAAFREDPQPWTWAAYHIADQLWTHITARRPTWLASALWAAQERLERGYEYNETHCYHCRWAWNTTIGDARDPYVCECWVAGVEAERDQYAGWLEQERQEREAITTLPGSV